MNRRIAAVAAFATTAAAGLAIAGSADAAVPAIQVKVCTSEALPYITVTGNNQDNVGEQWEHNSAVSAGGCVETTGWWWAKGQTLSVYSDYPGGGDYASCGIPADASGDWYTCNV